MVDPTTPIPYGDPWQPQPASGPPNPPTSPYPDTPPYPTLPSYPGTPPYSAPPQYSATPPYSAPPADTPYPVTAPYPPADSYPPGEPVIAQIGEIQVTATTVRTPAGQFPLKDSQWTVTDQWTATQKIPSWAITLAIVGFFCLTVFSLLFLLAKETVYNGVVLVQVHSGPFHYVARIPATNQMQVQHVYQQVNYVRSLAAL
jgi:hypothetical protein